MCVVDAYSTDVAVQRRHRNVLKLSIQVGVVLRLGLAVARCVRNDDFENTFITTLNTIKIANKLIKGHCRILVRKSGTEAKIRIMGESKNKVLLNKCIKNITKTIN